MKPTILSLLALSAGLLLLQACGASKQQAMLDTINSPSARPATFEALNEDLQLAERNQVNLISPQKFTESKKLIQEAHTLRNQGQSAEKYNEKLADARKTLDSAIAFTKVNKDQMGPLVIARDTALKSGAAETTNKELAALEKDYLRLVNNIDSRNSRAAALDQISEMTGDYQKLTVKTLQAKYLGEAKNNIRLADSEGAEDLVPKTFTEAKDSVEKTNDYIAQNSGSANWPTIIELGNASTLASRRLLSLTRETKNSTALSPEDRALKAEAISKTAGAESSKLQKNLKGSQQEVSDLKDRTKDYARLEMKDEDNKTFEQVRQIFDEDEAKVYRQGNNLIISLKKMNFPVNESSIPSSSFELLKKVQTAIKSFKSPSIVIEGHTDSTGNATMNKALSEKRAEAVREYFLSNNVVSTDAVEAIGFGSEKPLASNQSTDGRSVNRRIDVVIKN